MNIEQTVDRLIADCEDDRTKAAKYFWRDALDRVLSDKPDSRIPRSKAFTETVVFGRVLQLEQFPDDPGVKEELTALQEAIKRLRCEPRPH